MDPCWSGALPCWSEALRIYVVCRAGGVGQQHQVLGRGCISLALRVSFGSAVLGCSLDESITLSEISSTLNATVRR